MIVIDPSVAVKLINPQEEGSEKAQSLLASHLDGSEKIIVPSLLYLEFANTLVTKSKLSTKVIDESLKLLNKCGFIIHSFTKNNLLNSAVQARKYSTTIYDMLYAEVAEENKCKLITADEKFVKKTKFSFVELL